MYPVGIDVADLFGIDRRVSSPPLSEVEQSMNVRVQFPTGWEDWPAVEEKLRRPYANSPGGIDEPIDVLEPQPSIDWVFYPAGKDWVARPRRR